MYQKYFSYVPLFICIILSSTFFQSCTDTITSESPYALLSDDVAIIIKTKNFDAFYKNISSSKLWVSADISHSSFGKSIQNIKSLIDNIIPKSMSTKKEIEIIMSFKRAGLSHTDYTLIFNISGWSKKFLIDRIKNTSTLKSFQYDDKTIYKVTFHQKKSTPLFLFLNDNFLFGSPSKILVEEKIRELQNPNISLQRNSNFLSAVKITGRKDLANIFINPNKLSSISEIYFVPFLFPQKISPWIAIDCNVQEGEIVLNGGIISQEKEKTAVGTLSKIPFTDIGLINSAPKQSAFAISIAIDKSYSQEINKYQNVNKLSKALSIERQLRLDSIFSFVEKEICFFSTVPTSHDFSKVQYLMLGIKTNKITEKILDQLSETIKMPHGNNLKIKRFKEKELIPQYFGTLFKNFSKPYYVIFKDFILLANDLEGIKDISENILQKNTLQKSDILQKTKKLLGRNYNIMVYLNHLYTPNFLSFLLKETVLEKNQKIIRKMGNSLVHIRFDKTRSGYLNILQGKKEKLNLNLRMQWKYELKNENILSPNIFTNHYTKEKEIVVQDKKNTVYLMSSKGTTLWKRKIHGEIKSKIFQIDILKNQKFQMIFNTKEYIYCLDRKGRNVSPFPIKLPRYATSPLSVFDYDKKRNYRLVIALSDRIMMYDTKGKMVRGFQKSKNKNTINKEVQHFQFKNKDYLFFSDIAGNLDGVNRRGKTRIKASIPSKKFSSNPWYINIEKNGWITTDYYGNIITLNSKSGIRVQNKEKNEPDHLFLKTKKNYVLVQKDGLQILNSKGKIVSKTLDAIPYKGKTFSFAGQNYICFTDLEKELAYLFDEKGNSVDGFPIKSNALPLFIVNKNKKLNVITSIKNNIFSYEILDIHAIEK